MWEIRDEDDPNSGHATRGYARYSISNPQRVTRFEWKGVLNAEAGKQTDRGKVWPNFLTWDITFEIESPVDSGRYVKKVPFVIGSYEPVADHEIDDH